jgi:hypothetical protein
MLQGELRYSRSPLVIAKTLHCSVKLVSNFPRCLKSSNTYIRRQQLTTTTLGQGMINGVARKDISCALIEMSLLAEDTTGLVIAMTGARAHVYNGCNHNPTVYVPNRHWEL